MNSRIEINSCFQEEAGGLGARLHEVLAVDVKQMAGILPFSVRTLRRMDSAGRLPRGFKVGGRKVWRVTDLRLWCEWGFPARDEFEMRLQEGLALGLNMRYT